jgi:hypothetical protein
MSAACCLKTVFLCFESNGMTSLSRSSAVIVQSTLVRSCADAWRQAARALSIPNGMGLMYGLPVAEGSWMIACVRSAFQTVGFHTQNQQVSSI